jgi:hypothetical protein
MGDRELLTQLLKGDLQLSQQTVGEVVGRGNEIAEKLVEMLRNIRLWHTEEAGRVAVFHAVKLLGALKFELALPTLMDAIMLAASTSNEDVLDELPLALARIGTPGTAALRSILEDSTLDTTVRAVAASALEGIAVLHPDEQEAVLGTFRARISRSGESSTLRGHLLTLLAHFRQPEDHELIRSLAQVVPLEMEISGNDISSYFGDPDEPWEWAQYRVDPLEFYGNELV